VADSTVPEDAPEEPSVDSTTHDSFPLYGESSTGCDVVDSTTTVEELPNDVEDRRDAPVPRRSDQGRVKYVGSVRITPRKKSVDGGGGSTAEAVSVRVLQVPAPVAKRSPLIQTVEHLGNSGQKRKSAKWRYTGQPPAQRKQLQKKQEVLSARRPRVRPKSTTTTRRRTFSHGYGNDDFVYGDALDALVSPRPVPKRRRVAEADRSFSGQRSPQRPAAPDPDDVFRLRYVGVVRTFFFPSLWSFLLKQ
jgi:hypothetical protein